MIPELHPPKTDSKELRFDIRGKFRDKVRIAQTFQMAYDVLDRLCENEVQCLDLVYHEDFQVSDKLMSEFTQAAREALAYKDALSFGRSIDTRVKGVDQIADEPTRAMVRALHNL